MRDKHIFFILHPNKQKNTMPSPQRTFKSPPKGRIHRKESSSFLDSSAVQPYPAGFFSPLNQTEQWQ